MPARFAKINMLWLLLLGGAAAIVVLLGMLYLGKPHRDPDAKLIQVYCAAGLRPAMEKIAAKYKEEYGVDVEFQFGGSNTLLSQIKANPNDTHDLYLAADDSYTTKAVKEGYAEETLSIATMRPVIAVRQDSTKRIQSLDDLLQEGVSIVLGDPDQAAIGKAVRIALSKVKVGDTNRWQQLEARIRKDGVFKPTVNDAANDVKIGAVDAAIVWDSTVAMPQFRDVLRAVPIPEFEDAANLVSICVLKSTQNKMAALKFARYVTAIDRGLPVFEEFGTRPVEGDVWAERPHIKFFCGSVNRRAIEPILEKFEKDEGVDITTTYNGCGILTGSMKLFDEQRTDLGFPDCYMACDVYYLENVKDWFQDDVIVSETEIVIAVPKGSNKVKSLDDLLKPGVRVAIGQPEQCTLGALTRRLLQSEGLYDALMEKQKQSGETVVEFDSSARMVPQVTPIGDEAPADAAVAYITDVKPNADRVDVVHIDSPLNKAIQPFSIAKTSWHKELCRRLFRRIAASPEAFEDAGFHFRLHDEAKEDEGVTR